MIVTTTVETPFGDLLAGATRKGICLLEFTDTNRLEMQLSRLEKNYSTTIEKGDSVFFDCLREELSAYFEGTLKVFKVALDIQGTSFQKEAWKALLTIPYGQTRCYLEQAKAINKPKAFRAVASANRNNRVSIIIPCHRVIAKNGSLAGYGGGLQRKAFLLDLEKRYQA